MRFAIALGVGLATALLVACSAAPAPAPTSAPSPSSVATVAAPTPTLPAPTPADQAGQGTVVSGYVVGGGDTTPPDLHDAPRRFVYQVKTDSGETVNVTYTAYPPSPVGDRERGKITLNFAGGAVQVGQYLKARGTLDATTAMLLVAEQGDYIETTAAKP
ncbi:MAG: hypothetical protein ACYC1C_00310 [Chloroflexota bacterium]